MMFITLIGGPGCGRSYEIRDCNPMEADVLVIGIIPPDLDGEEPDENGVFVIDHSSPENCKYMRGPKKGKIWNYEYYED